MAQTTHSLRRNFPFLANARYVLETLRPELRQYLFESDNDGTPFDRAHRSVAYARAKGSPDTVAFGTRRNVYAENYEFAAHSMFPADAAARPAASRVLFGEGNPGVAAPYSADLLNVSGMSYGALSENAGACLARATSCVAPS